MPQVPLSRWASTMELIKELRGITHAPILDCKKALSTIEILAGLVVCTKVVEIFFNPAGMLLQVRDAMVILTEIDHEVKQPPRGMKDVEKYHKAMKTIKGNMLHVNHEHAGRLHPSHL